MNNYKNQPPEFFSFMPPNLKAKGKGRSYSMHAAKKIGEGESLGLIRVHFHQGFSPDRDRDYIRAAGWSEMVNEDRVDPSCVTVDKPCNNNPTIKKLVYVVTLRDIGKGEEITWKYTLEEYEGAPWRRPVINATSRLSPKR